MRLLGFAAGLLLLGANVRAQENGWGSSWTNAPTDHSQANRTVGGEIGRDLETGNNAEAERHLAELLRENPASAGAYRVAAMVHWKMHRYQAALDDCDHGIQLLRETTPSELGEVYLLRSHIYLAMKNYSAARAEDERAVRSNKRSETFNNDLAWLLATCPDARVRDGGLAVRYAKTACELGGSHDPEMLDTLAAAEAEAGQFDLAAQDEQRAIALSKKDRLAGAQKRLSLYQNHQPYHERADGAGPPPPPSRSS